MSKMTARIGILELQDWLGIALEVVQGGETSGTGTTGENVCVEAAKAGRF